MYGGGRSKVQDGEHGRSNRAWIKIRKEGVLRGKARWRGVQSDANAGAWRSKRRKEDGRAAVGTECKTAVGNHPLGESDQQHTAGLARQLVSV